jgi:cell division control protein 45
MYLPRSLLSHLYLRLQTTQTSSSPPVLILPSLDPDALCATRILSALLKRDFIQHTIRPVAGYADLTAAGELVRKMRTTEGGDGGVVVCLGVGGLVDLEELLGCEDGWGNVLVWVADSRRPWNLVNVFGAVGEEKIRGVDKGRVSKEFVGREGVVVWDDGDVDECMQRERDAYCELAEMPELGDDDADIDSDDEANDGKFDYC